MTAGDMLGAISFRKRKEISSRPLALCGFKSSSIFLTPLFCITSGGDSDFRLFPMEGMLLQSSLVNADANWSFRISALSLASE